MVFSASSNPSGIVLLDRASQIRTLISPENQNAVINTDGRYVSYTEYQETGNTLHLYDRITQTTQQIVNPNIANIEYQRISGDGHYIVYSAQENISCGFACFKIYLWDRLNNTHELINVASDETPGDRFSIINNINHDGSRVVFLSAATNLVQPHDNCSLPNFTDLTHIYLRDRTLGTTERINFDPQGNPLCEAVVFALVYGIDISGNGRYVVMMGDSDGDIGESPDDPNAIVDGVVYLRDLETDTTELISIDSQGLRIANAIIFGSQSISDDGRFVLFGDEDGRAYVRDRFTNLTTIVNRDEQNNFGLIDDRAGFLDFEGLVSLSANGHQVLFASSSELLSCKDKTKVGST